MNPTETRQQKKRLSEAYFDHSKNLRTYSSYKVSNSELGDDLVQDAFMKTWKYLLRDGKIIVMKSFIYHVLNQLIIDEYRKNKPISLDVLLDKGFIHGLDERNRMFDIHDGRIVILLIPYLPLNYQECIKLRYLKGLSNKEIALITGLSKNAVAVRIHRGIQKLKVLYHHQ